MGDLSPHFSRSELECRCCARLQLDSRLLNGLEALRVLAGVPVIVHAGYRCPRHNQEVGGVPRSEHTLGMAADVAVAGISLQRMYNLRWQFRSSLRGALEFTTADFCTSTFGNTARAGRE